MEKSKLTKNKTKGTMKPSLLIVDDDERVRQQLYWELSDNFRVSSAADAVQAAKLLRKQAFDIALTDLHMPPNADTPESGLSLLADILKEQPETVVIIMTGDTEKNTALEAVERGAWDVFIKPLNPDELGVVINRALRLRKLVKENQRLRLEQPAAENDMVGSSPAMQQLFATINQVAPTDATVYISGESGTGKELVARALHEKSLRKDAAFVAVNCAALSDSLLEDELFGHESGAYTGSKGARKGKFELADGGTIFLDEVAELSPAAQAKLLRILQEGTFERLGSERSRQVNVRVIAATHQNLHKRVEEGAFREDLYYRLNVIPVKVPPLRERKGDIPSLAAFFLENFRSRMNRGPKSFSPEAMQILMQCTWKGNVRELRNLIERLVILVNHPVIQAGDLPAEYSPAGNVASAPAEFPFIQQSADDAKSYEEAVNAFRKSLLEQALARYGSKSRTAAALGINRSYLYELLEKLHVTA